MSWLEPRRRPGEFAFVTVREAAELEGLDVHATVREREALTAVVPLDQAQERRLRITFVAAWIELDLLTELDTVGITARFAPALAAAGIACNVIAGACHDHVLVPIENADEALAILADVAPLTR